MATDRELLRDRKGETRAVFVGHLYAVSGATLVYLLLLFLKTLAGSVPSSDDRAGVVSAGSGDILIFGIVGAGFWIGAFVTALPSVVAAHGVARWLGLRSAFYYAACGALTGLMLTPVFVLIGPQTSWQNENDLLHDCLSWGPILIASGLCGALAFWYKAGRHIKPLAT